ncbi:MAG: NAD(P)/FAD-dependent oxidoreductase [Chitinophagales bacterium]|nr:NAD(P)/FAD-dependent oxidoreductase [Chitinophagales bacterium]
MKVWDLIIVGGGAAGFFTAINLKEREPNLSVLILEKDKELLKKVKISGGGRCNVTHACFEPKELVKFYPRGSKELLGPFHQFCTGDMMAWLDERGVPTKIEEDNRVFPESNESQTIIDCFLELASRYQVKISTLSRVDKIEKLEHWRLVCGSQELECKNLVMASGSSPKVWDLIDRDLQHSIVPPVPSLFTFNCKDERIQDLMGISVPHARVKIINEKLQAEGPLLITHWGLSGPAILRLSAWGALRLNALQYHFKIEVNWLGFESLEECRETLIEYKTLHSKKSVSKHCPYNLPKRLWESFVANALAGKEKNWADLSKQELQNIAQNLVACSLEIKGKSTFKDEFVTAGGVALEEINFKSFSSKLHPNLYFAGEVLNIDAITGGFNFQAAWTGAWLIAQDLATNASASIEEESNY